VSGDLHEALQNVLPRYPDRHSAVIPALRLAQEKYGWLSPDALRDAAAALDETPAYCLSIASFYDMFHLEPVGRHSVEVCTNLACALAGARDVVVALADELGIGPGETTPDGEISLRTVECLGGCGYATVVSVDQRYRHHVTAANAAEIVEELRGRD
jgi:NADH-quinone oxidoreductase subunit E